MYKDVVKSAATVEYSPQAQKCAVEISIDTHHYSSLNICKTKILTKFADDFRHVSPGLFYETFRTVQVQSVE